MKFELSPLQVIIIRDLVLNEEECPVCKETAIDEKIGLCPDCKKQETET